MRNLNYKISFYIWLDFFNELFGYLNVKLFMINTNPTILKSLNNNYKKV